MSHPLRIANTSRLVIVSGGQGGVDRAATDRKVVKCQRCGGTGVR